MLEGSHNIIKLYGVYELNWEQKTAHVSARHFHALSIRLDGGADFTVGDKIYTTKRNDILFMPKGCSYTFAAHRSERIICVHFDTDSPIDPLPEVFTPVSGDLFVGYFTELAHVWQKKSSGYRYAAYSMVYKILETVAEQKRQMLPPSGRKAELCERAVSHINRSFTNPELSVSELARICNVSEVYLRKIFKEERGISPKEYIEKRRLAYSAELLQSGFYTVEQVAEMCGIPNAKYFSRFFKEKQGVSPSKMAKVGD